MFCQNCNAALSSGEVFCSNCGTPTAPPVPFNAPAGELPTVVVPGQPTAAVPPAYLNTAAAQATPQPAAPNGSPLKRFFASTRNRIITGAAAVLAVVLAIVVSNIVANMPKKVEIRLAIQDTYGGVFESKCKITADAATQVPNQVKVFETGSKTPAATAKVTYYASGSKGCIGKADVELNPTKHYDVVGASETLGTISNTEFNSGVADVAKSVEIFRSLTVDFNLYDYEDYCTGSDSSWTCYPGYFFSLETDAATSTCKGTGGFSDIHEGTGVTVTGQSSGRSYSGTLVSDGWDLVSVSSAQLFCKYHADFSDLPNDPAGYTVEVSTRGGVSYSIDDLSINGWVAPVNLNK